MDVHKGKQEQFLHEDGEHVKVSRFAIPILVRDLVPDCIYEKLDGEKPKLDDVAFALTAAMLFDAIPKGKHMSAQLEWWSAAATTPSNLALEESDGARV